MATSTQRMYLFDDTSKQIRNSGCLQDNECIDFLNFYLQINREDLYESYVNEYCHGESRGLCARKKHTEKHGISPPYNLSPTGVNSLLHRFFSQR